MQHAFSTLARLGRALFAARRRQQAVRQLESLDHRMLADIGLRRSEIELAVRGGRTARIIRDRFVAP